MANETTTTWTLGELCDYWRANLARLQASMDFRTLAAIQDVFTANQTGLKIGADNLFMPVDAAAARTFVNVPAWIQKPGVARGLPILFRTLGVNLTTSEFDDARQTCDAIAAEFESTGTNPFEQKGPLGIQAAPFAFPAFDLMKVLALLSRFGPLLARIDQIKAMPQGKERVAATAKLVADITAAVAEMLGTGSTVKGPFGAARRGRKAGKR